MSYQIIVGQFLRCQIDWILLVIRIRINLKTILNLILSSLELIILILLRHLRFLESPLVELSRLREVLNLLWHIAVVVVNGLDRFAMSVALIDQLIFKSI